MTVREWHRNVRVIMDLKHYIETLDWLKTRMWARAREPRDKKSVVERYSRPFGASGERFCNFFRISLETD